MRKLISILVDCLRDLRNILRRKPRYFEVKYVGKK